MALSNKQLAAKRAKKKANRNKKSPSNTPAPIQPIENQDDEFFQAYYFSPDGKQYCLHDSEEDNRNQENIMFNKNRPVIDFDDDNENFWDDEEASTMVAKNVFKNAIALTQLVAEKDENIRSKKQILDTYEEAFMRIMGMLDKMK